MPYMYVCMLCRYAEQTSFDFNAFKNTFKNKHSKTCMYHIQNFTIYAQIYTNLHKWVCTMQAKCVTADQHMCPL